MKKYLCAAVMAVLLLVLCCASVMPIRSGFLSDVEESDPNYPFIVELAQEGLLSTYLDETFRADEPVTRRTAMEKMLEALGAVGLELDYAAVLNKLVYVWDETGLDEPVTRLEAAGMAARALDLLPMAGESPYADCDNGYVVKLWERGVWVTGDSLFRPNDFLTRGELAGLLWHMARFRPAEEAFRYSGYWVEPLDGVKPFGYDSAVFGVDGNAVTCMAQGYTVLQGVDVSGFQGDIDWERVKADGIDFAIVRVGGRFMQSGGLYDDSYFERNVEGALAAGLQVGVYFFSQAITPEEGVEEAEYVLSKIEGYDITMPVIMDWEHLDGSESRVYGVEPAQVTASVRAFCDRVRQAGYEPMIYMNSYCGYIKMDLRQLTDVGFWFAQYTPEPVFRYHFDLWQYTDRGQVDGINGNVDRNLYFQK